MLGLIALSEGCCLGSKDGLLWLSMVDTYAGTAGVFHTGTVYLIVGAA